MSESLCGMCKDGWEKVWMGDYQEWQWTYCYDCSVVRRSDSDAPAETAVQGKVME